MSEMPKIESQDITIQDLFKDFYVVPDFQREYVWQEKNVEALLRDVMAELYDEAYNVVGGREYFIGSVVTCPDDGRHQLIDGQQRVTTIYLLLCALRDAFRQSGAEVPAYLPKYLFDVAPDGAGEAVQHYRVDLQYEDAQGFLEAIVHYGLDLDSATAKTPSAKNLLSAYSTIRRFLTETFADDPAKLKKFTATFISSVKLIRIKTPSVTNALKVFETINDRGVGLDAVDLLKNLLFMKTPRGLYPKLKDRWKTLTNTLNRCREKPLRFLRYFVISNHDVPDWQKGFREEQVYEWFVRNSANCHIDDNPIGFVDTLIDRAIAYANFAEGRDVVGQLNPYISNVAACSGTARTHFILLLAGENLPSELFTELARRVENLFFCYLITRANSVLFDRYFTRWAPELRKVQTKEQLEAFFTKWFEPQMRERSFDFDFAFRELTESRIQQYRLKYVLAKFTQYIDQQAWGEEQHLSLTPYLDKKVEIEHILPRHPAEGVREGFDVPQQYDDFVPRLGNLMLLEKSINGSVSNSTYDKKKPGYPTSKFLLTRSVAERPQLGQAGAKNKVNLAVAGLPTFDTWTSQAITERQEALAKLARKVWGIPDATTEVTHASQG
jgi:hypothetical protein